MLSKAPDLHLHAMLNFISSIFQLWGESVSLVILFLCLGLAKMVFCSEGEPPVGVLHSDTEPSRASSVLRCFSKYDLGLTLPSVGHFVRKWITWITKYTIRSIVCEASCHSVTWSLGHSVTRSYDHYFQHANGHTTLGLTGLLHRQ